VTHAAAAAAPHLSSPTVHRCWLITPTMPGSEASLNRDAAQGSAAAQRSAERQGSRHSTRTCAWTPGTALQVCQAAADPPVQQPQRLCRRRGEPGPLPRLVPLESVLTKRWPAALWRRPGPAQLPAQLVVKRRRPAVLPRRQHSLHRLRTAGQHLQLCAAVNAWLRR
jgi:hypothetical protein